MRHLVLALLVGCANQQVEHQVCNEGRAVQAGQVVACVDVIATTKLHDCEYEGGIRTALSNARVQIRTLDVDSGVELARVTHELRHDTSNVVSRGCPMRFENQAETLPSFERELAALVASSTRSLARLTARN